MFAETMEDMLKAELETELGYKKHSVPEGHCNRRNGSYAKTVQSSFGEIDLDIPRDRSGDYNPADTQRNERCQRTRGKGSSLYAKGTSDGIYPMS